ncbi:concanavalin A-like lectin/glucanase domain-containing protein [Achaetomium macrosporum]|uniref:Concanavalin A-like lectin/glucanase domain-containing protein n=1 Tax=Achaetomium macrosporum TaxID=79813 RepID=A0AAN7CBP5_9PEZI|nr:concanavalin A-like lectin/glucanase domain-containing protein [Achaetomium macrosporum]
MHFTSYISLLPILGASVSAWDAPGYSGYSLRWQDTFAGPSGNLPNENNWNIIDGYLNVNAELETYKRNPRQVQTSGGNTLQIVPWNDGGSWTSGRIESKYTFTPENGKRTMAEAAIRFGGNPIDTKQGIWPAFWLLGDSLRRGGSWPACGELDILETVNGQLTGYGTAHCDVYPGGICNEPTGRGATIAIPNQDWQTWRIVWDRTNGDWRAQSITWYMNGQQFQQITGAQINNEDVWNTLAASPLYFILNVAVGGNWPGYPNSATQGGYGAMMEVGYVAHYSS